MDFLAELKRRKVIRTAVIYVTAGWVLLQAADLLLNMLEVPHWGLKLVFVLLLIGFPLALWLSWINQITPQGVRRETAAAEPATASPAEVAAAQARPASAAADPRSLAVLPFANMSEERANEHFADGLAEELLNLLSRMPGLRVVARTSSFSFKGRAVGAAEIARELGVEYLLDGSVRKSGSRIRISAQLIRAADSWHVWSQSFDRDLSDIFAVQDEIAAAVAAELKVKLLGGFGPRSAPTDPRAYSLYLEGRHFFSLASAPGSQQAEQALRAALAIDDKFAPAWAVLGALHWIQANNSLISYTEGVRQARLASQKALGLDPGLAEPMSLLGLLDQSERRDWAGGMERVRRALELEPHNARVLSRASAAARALGLLEEAVHYGERALQADPLSPNAHASLSLACYYSGRLDEAETQRRKTLAMSPGWLSGYYYLGLVLLARGDPAAALEAMQQEQSPNWRLVGLALVCHALGRHAESDAALEDFRRLGLDGAAYQFADVHAFRGEVDLAFEWLDRALATRDSGVGDAPVDPLLRPLHPDSRWKRFIALRAQKI